MWCLTKGTTIPIQPLEIEHVLTDVPMPRLMHAQHTVQALHRTTGPYHPSYDLLHPFVSLVPLGRQTLTYHLFDHHQLREVGALWPMREFHRSPPRPQTGCRRAQQRFLNSLGQLLMHPIEMVECPRITQQPPYLAPLLSVQFCQGSADLPLRPLPVAETSFGAKEGQG